MIMHVISQTRIKKIKICLHQGFMNKCERGTNVASLQLAAGLGAVNDNTTVAVLLLVGLRSP